MLTRPTSKRARRLRIGIIGWRRGMSSDAIHRVAPSCGELSQTLRSALSSAGRRRSNAAPLLFEHLIRDLGGPEEIHTTIQEAIAVRHATEAPPSEKVGAF